MTASSLGKYSGSAQYNSPEKGAAAGNDTALAGALSTGSWRCLQGRGSQLRALPWDSSADVCTHSRAHLPRKQSKSQTSLQLSPLAFCLTVGSSHFLGRKIEHLRSTMSSSAPVLGRTRAKRSTRMCLILLEGTFLYFPPCFAEHACWWAAGQAGKADL